MEEQEDSLITQFNGTKRYNDFGSFIRAHFHERVQKISVDTGFTCPNRDGSKGVGGCTYCNNNSFNPNYCKPEKSITEQLNHGIDFFMYKSKTTKFLAYFQAYTNTYADIELVKELYLEQLNAFGDVDRYPLKRVITIAFYALTRPENYELIPGFTAKDVKWFNIQDLADLPYDHSEILRFAWQRLKRQVKYEPIGFNLLPEKFTLLQLQELYEAILETKLDKPNFRRKIMKMDLLISCNEKQKGVSHRAAILYRFDKQVYDKLKQEGFIFEF